MAFKAAISPRGAILLKHRKAASLTPALRPCEMHCLSNCFARLPSPATSGNPVAAAHLTESSSSLRLRTRAFTAVSWQGIPLGVLVAISNTALTAAILVFKQGLSKRRATTSVTSLGQRSNETSVTLDLCPPSEAKSAKVRIAVCRTNISESSRSLATASTARPSPGNANNEKAATAICLIFALPSSKRLFNATIIVSSPFEHTFSATCTSTGKSLSWA
mmetsp:Transcript_850/g.1425  ORF Transcript_850/g.1425 Transcript_850/m.1425 type:complete len:219 (+) Transcript_850:891-1547(+)